MTEVAEEPIPEEDAQESSSTHGLLTSMQVQAWRERLRSEKTLESKQRKEALKRLDGVLPNKTSYLELHLCSNAMADATESTVDQSASQASFNPKVKRDRFFPLERVRRDGKSSRFPVVSSQSYGNGRPLEDPKSWGFSRTGVIEAAQFDRSHLHV